MKSFLRPEGVPANRSLSEQFGPSTSKVDNGAQHLRIGQFLADLSDEKADSEFCPFKKNGAMNFRGKIVPTVNPNKTRFEGEILNSSKRGTFFYEKRVKSDEPVLHYLNTFYHGQALTIKRTCQNTKNSLKEQTIHIFVKGCSLF